MGKVTLHLGLQPADMDKADIGQYHKLGADTYSYTAGYMHDYNTSKDFLRRGTRVLGEDRALYVVDSHLFNNWDNDDQWNLLLSNTKAFAQLLKDNGADGIVLDCEQENHLIPFGKSGMYMQSDPKYVWPSGKRGPERCRSWVDAIKSVWPTGEIHLWLTSAVQLNANPNFYPCVNAMCEQANGAHLWLYMWETGYDFGRDSNLPKRKELPEKYKKGKSWFQIGDYKLWEKTALASFTQKVKNTIHPTISFGVDSVQYYQNQIKAGNVKDFSGMVSKDYIKFYRQAANVNLVLWGNVWDIEPTMWDYTAGLIKQLKG